MKIKIILIVIIIAICGLPAKAQFIVSDPLHMATSTGNQAINIIEYAQTVTNTLSIFNQAKEYYDKLMAVNNLIKDAQKVIKIGVMVSDIIKIGGDATGKISSNPHFSASEISAILGVYQTISEDVLDMMQELSTVINVSSLSMTDRERMQVIDNVYDKVRHQRTLISYFTSKNMSIAYAREDNVNRLTRVESLFGSDSERYW